jgi:hypothetical protein
MLAQVIEVLFPGVPYTSSDGTWKNLILDGGNIVKPVDEVYELELYKLTNADAIKKFREERNTLLDQSDKYVTPDYPHLLEKDIQDWKEYRQHLRDLPGMSSPDLDEDGNLVGVEWPTFEGIEVKVTPPSKTELLTTKTELKADLSETKSELKADLQTTRTELAEAKTDLEEKTYQIISLEARLAALEQKFISN